LFLSFSDSRHSKLSFFLASSLHLFSPSSLLPTSVLSLLRRCQGYHVWYMALYYVRNIFEKHSTVSCELMLEACFNRITLHISVCFLPLSGTRFLSLSTLLCVFLAIISDHSRGFYSVLTSPFLPCLSACMTEMMS
jgi:hypothetical protein